MKPKLSIYWARRDLRLEDNPALTAACRFAREQKCELLPLFVLEDYMCVGDPRYLFGHPSQVFLSKALPHFAQKFETFALVRGKGARTLVELSKKADITVFVNEDIHEDFFTQIKKIKAEGIDIKLYTDALTIDKNTVSQTGTQYSVFTPFKKNVWHSFVTAAVLPAVSFEQVQFFSLTKSIGAELFGVDTLVPATEKDIAACFSHTRVFKVEETVYDIDTLHTDRPSLDAWYWSEEEALNLFETYITQHLSLYKDERNSLELDRTSRMSLALAWGLVSARMLVQKIKLSTKDPCAHFEGPACLTGALHYISELIWREFYKYLYFHNPRLENQEFQQKFRGTILWAPEDVAHARFVAWMKGETGYPVVDAAMHQLAQTGWMHNRARMIVASVLTKNLGVDWRWGQEYFRAVLIDLDEASNNGGWQWGASVGADPKPIRIFNPYLQADTYDAKEIYQRKYLPASYFEHPPTPIIEHKTARVEALKRYGLSEAVDGSARDY